MKNTKEALAKRSTGPAPPVPKIGKRSRSELPRRRMRSQISPISSSIVEMEARGECVSKDSSSCFRDEASCDSNRAPEEAKRTKKCAARKRDLGEVSGVSEEFRRVTRSYYKKKKEIERRFEEEVSESSCVESHSGVVDVKFCGERSLSSKNRSEGVKEIAVSEITCVEQISGEVLKSGAGNENKSSEIEQKSIVSLDICGAESYSEVNFKKSLEKTIKDSENRASGIEFSEFSRNCDDTVSNSESTINQNDECFKFASDLTCTEELSDGEKPETAFSTFQSEIFQEYSDLDFSDRSYIFTSGSEFSEKSIEDSNPSPTFSLLVEYRHQFSKSTSPPLAKASTHSEDHFQFVKLEDEEDEESYQLLRSRERRDVFLRNYADEYGQLVIEQRSKMVRWMVEQCSALELQYETLFLGVSLLDRFLSRGFLNSKRDLQIVGIACLTLATRIEENQPYNRIRKKNLYVGNNVYKRCEVVAMEWLVQEVLNFQCFSPTIYNFLWFYLKAARADAETEKIAKYLAVLFLSETEQLLYYPSTIAASIVILASPAENETASKQVIECHVRTSNDCLSECTKSLSWLLKYIC